MWPWIYRIIAALLALIGAGVLAALGRALHRVSRHAGALVVQFGEPAALVAGLAALVLVTLHSIVDFSLQIPGVAVYVAAAIAAAVAVALGRAGEDGADRPGLHNRAA